MNNFALLEQIFPLAKVLNYYKGFFLAIWQLLEVIRSAKVNSINISDCSPLLSSALLLLLGVDFKVKFNRLLYFICSPFVFISVCLHRLIFQGRS